MDYRRDIDGLRAVAVLPVIFFHAGVGLFSGGFLGVDIFFVISGFLITSILIHELANNKFSIVNFYERRARRILPALFAVLALTYLAGLVLMPPFEFKEYSQSIVSVISFLSNIFFYSEIDYFSLAAEEMPLLHTWSLAIEEQFYIFFPPLLYLIWRFARKSLLVSLIALSILSFTSVLVLNNSGDYSASFYWPISRAWELLAGSICAYFAYHHSFKNTKYIADMAFVVLLLCLFIWSSDFVHPGYLTIIPVVATCLIILFPNKESVSYQILSNKFFVYVGLISYSLYLWHQPIFAFLRMKSVGHPPVEMIWLAIGLTFISAYFSYRFVEVPFRDKQKYNRKFIFSSSTLLLSLFLAVGLIGHFSQGFKGRFDHITSYQDSIAFSPKREQCHSSDLAYLSPNRACKYFTQKPSWAVFGDSHLVEPAYALANILKQHNIGLSHHSHSGCSPALNYEVKGKEVCTKWINDTLAYLENTTDINTVVVGFRYSSGLFGDNVLFYPDIPNQLALEVISSNPLTEKQKLEMYWQDLEELVERLLSANKRVLLLEPIPELPTHIGRAVTAFSIFSNDTLIDLNSATTKEYYEKRHAFILDKLRGLKHDKNLILVNVYDLLCSDKGCPAIIDNKAIYFDDDHLSVDGSRILLEQLFNQPEIAI